MRIIYLGGDEGSWKEWGRETGRTATPLPQRPAEILCRVFGCGTAPRGQERGQRALDGTRASKGDCEVCSLLAEGWGMAGTHSVVQPQSRQVRLLEPGPLSQA